MAMSSVGWALSFDHCSTIQRKDAHTSSIYPSMATMTGQAWIHILLIMVRNDTSITILHHLLSPSATRCAISCSFSARRMKHASATLSRPCHSNQPSSHHACVSMWRDSSRARSFIDPHTPRLRTVNSEVSPMLVSSYMSVRRSEFVNSDSGTTPCHHLPPPHRLTPLFAASLRLQLSSE